MSSEFETDRVNVVGITGQFLERYSGYYLVYSKMYSVDLNEFYFLCLHKKDAIRICNERKSFRFFKI